MDLIRKFSLQAALFAGLLAVIANLKPIAMAAIGIYQAAVPTSLDRPCGHRLILGGESCSAFAKRAIGEDGFLRGMNESLVRFRECGRMSKGEEP